VCRSSPTSFLLLITGPSATFFTQRSTGRFVGCGDPPGAGHGNPPETAAKLGVSDGQAIAIVSRRAVSQLGEADREYPEDVGAPSTAGGSRKRRVGPRVRRERQRSHLTGRAHDRASAATGCAGYRAAWSLYLAPEQARAVTCSASASRQKAALSLPSCPLRSPQPHQRPYHRRNVPPAKSPEMRRWVSRVARPVMLSDQPLLPCSIRAPPISQRAPVAVPPRCTTILEGRNRLQSAWWSRRHQSVSSGTLETPRPSADVPAIASRRTARHAPINQSTRRRRS
jgi:hypothetical protein